MTNESYSGYGGGMKAESVYARDLETLAETAALCERKLEHRVCSKRDCKKCETHREWEACYNELPACDRLYVKNAAVKARNRISGGLPSWGVLDQREHMDRLAERRDAKDSWAVVVFGLGGAILFAVAFFLPFFI